MNQKNRFSLLLSLFFVVTLIFAVNIQNSSYEFETILPETHVLNDVFEVTRIESLSSQKEWKKESAVQKMASFFEEKKEVSEILLETRSGEIYLLKSKSDIPVKKIAQEYSYLPIVKNAEENIRGKFFSSEFSKPSLFVQEKNQKPKIQKKSVVAMIDTGLDALHPAMQHSIWENEKEKYGKKGVDDDKNGYIDDIQGWNFGGNSSDISDAFGHGTHLSGIISADAEGNAPMKGLYPEEVKIMPLRVVGDEKNLRVSDVISALKYAKKQNVDVVNMSFGFDESSKILENLLQKMSKEDIFLVAAVGNNGENTPVYPAAYPEVFSVGSSDIFGNKRKKSNYGDWVDAYFPGKILSTLPENKYGVQAGTSQSSAFVSGLSASIRAENPEISSEEIQEKIFIFLDNIQKINTPPRWFQEVLLLLQKREKFSDEIHQQYRLSRVMTAGEIFTILSSLFSQDLEMLKILISERRKLFPIGITPEMILNEKFIFHAEKNPMHKKHIINLIRTIYARLHPDLEYTQIHAGKNNTFLSRKEFVTILQKIFPDEF